MYQYIMMYVTVEVVISSTSNNEKKKKLNVHQSGERNRQQKKVSNDGIQMSQIIQIMEIAPR